MDLSPIPTLAKGVGGPGTGPPLVNIILAVILIALAIWIIANIVKNIKK